MNRLALWLLLLACTLGATAQEATRSEPQAPQENRTPADQPVIQDAQKTAPDSPLVAAAKRAKGGKIKPGLVVTNENVGKIKGVGGSVITATPPDPNAPAYDPAASAPPGADRGKEEWQKLMGEARSAVAASEARLSSLQGEVARLQNDFYAWDDPAYRDGVIKPALDKALADLEAEKQALAAARQRILDLEEEARKAGALPGWLR